MMYLKSPLGDLAVVHKESPLQGTERSFKVLKGIMRDSMAYFPLLSNSLSIASYLDLSS